MHPPTKRKVKINRPTNTRVSWKQVKGQPLGFIWRTGKRSFKGFRTY